MSDALQARARQRLQRWPFEPRRQLTVYRVEQRVPITIAKLSGHRNAFRSRFFCNEAAMTQPAAPERSPAVRFIRRSVAALLLGFIVFAVLWVTVFNAITSAIVASGGAIALVAGSSVSETFQSIFEMIAEFILSIFGAIADFFSALFDW